MNNYNEFKNTISKRVYNREIPKEVYEKIDKIRKYILSIYENKYENINLLEEYINNQFHVLRAIINKTGEIRNEKNIDEIINTINRFQNKLESNEYKISANEMVFMDEDEIEQKEKELQVGKESIDFENCYMYIKETVNTIIIELENVIKDINNTANRTFQNRDIDYDKLEDIQNDISKIIYSLKTSESDNFENIIKQYDIRFLNELKVLYEEFLTNNNKTNHEKFVESISVQDSLEEQKKFVEDFLEKQEGNEEKTKNEDYFK